MKNAAPHTNGPWTFFENCEGYTVQGPNREPVAYCDHDLEDEAPSRAKANAQLIAAAPELLEALQLVLKFPVPTGESRIGRDKVIRAAIAKATA